MRRRRAALAGMFTPRIASHALAEAMQMAHRADAADARHQRRHFVEWPVLAEFFEAAQLRDVEARVGDLAVVVELNGYLGVAFDACYRIDDNSSVP